MYNETRIGGAYEFENSNNDVVGCGISKYVNKLEALNKNTLGSEFERNPDRQRDNLKIS